MDDIRFEKNDMEFIKNMDISLKQVRQQVKWIKQGMKPIPIAKPARLNDGIIKLTEDEQNKMIHLFEQKAGQKKIIQFIPASGAASRMFKDLVDFAFLAPFPSEDEISIQAMTGKKEYVFLQNFINGLHEDKFAFIDDLKKYLQRQGLNYHRILQEKNYPLIIKFLLFSEGLNYIQFPKALIKFHRYAQATKTALEEQIEEGWQFLAPICPEVNIHFSVPPAQQHLFTQITHAISPKYSGARARLKISVSPQKPNTHTIVLNSVNQLIRDENNHLVFRPGGHGALLSNLNQLAADLIFIKNIDNITIDRIKKDAIKYKKILAGLLIDIQNKTFDFLWQLVNSKLNPNMLNELIHFANTQLNINLAKNFATMAENEKTTHLINLLNRPIRVCGMVKNVGEPGGGPFWIKKPREPLSLQIIEAIQIDQESASQRDIFNQATHFNPVDMVCGIKNFRGEKFNLAEYVDQNQYMLSKKMTEGKSIKALELPGLWNGGMAGWISIFIEIPNHIFNPVKTINDLLRPAHQN